MDYVRKVTGYNEAMDACTRVTDENEGRSTGSPASYILMAHKLTIGSQNTGYNSGQSQPRLEQDHGSLRPESRAEHRAEPELRRS